MKRRSFLATVAGFFGLGGSMESFLTDVPQAACDCGNATGPVKVTISAWPEGEDCVYDFWSPACYEMDWSGQAFRPTGREWATNWDETVRLGLHLQGPAGGEASLLGDVGGDE